MLLPFLLLFLFQTILSILVHTPFGKIRGFNYTTESGNEVNVFLGVRYAEEPSGSKRFEKSTMIKPWDGVLDALKFSPVCFPHHRDTLEDKEYSEDCLSVNFVVPSTKDAESLPVLVFIHGGGYEVGNAHTYGYKIAAENFARRGIIFVSLQYRLGFLGFFSSGDDEIPGNYGYWDQKLALEFIREIVPSLGGDVNRITIMGHSAGSSSISGLLLSPHSQGLFDQTIQLSGSGTAEFAFSDRVVKDSMDLAHEVGCSNEDVKLCLQGKTVDELFDAMTKLGGYRRHITFLKFHPRFDGDFFPIDNMELMLKQAPKRRSIQGLANKESLLFTTILDNNEAVSGDIYIPENKRETFGAQDITKFLKYTFSDDEFGALNSAQINELVLDFYTGEHSKQKNSTFYINSFTDYMSDIMFNIPVYKEVQLKVENGWETYFYVIDHISSSTKNTNITGFIHGDELRFMFEFFGQENIPLTEEDKLFQNTLISALVNFIKEGSPSTDNCSWPPVSSENPNLHLLLRPKSELSEEFFRKEAAKFWLSDLPKTFGVEKMRTLFPVLPKSPQVHSEL